MSHHKNPRIIRTLSFDQANKPISKKVSNTIKNYKDMIEHIDRFNDHNINFLVFGRKVGKKFISLDSISVPDIIKDRCTGFDEGTFRDDVSSTEIRLTQN